MPLPLSKVLIFLGLSILLFFLKKDHQRNDFCLFSLPHGSVMFSKQLSGLWSITIAFFIQNNAPRKGEEDWEENPWFIILHTHLSGPCLNFHQRSFCIVEGYFKQRPFAYFLCARQFHVWETVKLHLVYRLITIICLLKEY